MVAHSEDGARQTPPSRSPWHPRTAAGNSRSPRPEFRDNQTVDGHTALDSSVIGRDQADNVEVVLVRLVHGRYDVEHTIHIAPTSSLNISGRLVLCRGVYAGTVGCGCAPGRACTPGPRTTRPRAVTAPKPSCAAPWCWSKWSACHARPVSQTPLAVVARTRPAGSRPALAGLRPAVRSGTHL